MSRRSKAFIPLGLLVIAWIGGGGLSASSQRQAPEAGVSVRTAAGDSDCDPRDPVSECYYEPPRGIPVGELLIVDNFF